MRKLLFFYCLACGATAVAGWLMTAGAHTGLFAELLAVSLCGAGMIRFA